MSISSANLDQVRLLSAADELELRMRTTADFRLPGTYRRPRSQTALFEHLFRDDVWVSRGQGCCLDFSILYNGSPLKSSSNAITETIGRYLRNAELWAQLSLSVSLEILNSQVGGDDSGMSFRLKITSSCQNSDPRSEIGLPKAPQSLVVPEGFVVAELQALRLTMDFITTRGCESHALMHSSVPENDTMGNDGTARDDDFDLFLDDGDSGDDFLEDEADCLAASMPDGDDDNNLVMDWTEDLFAEDVETNTCAGRHTQTASQCTTSSPSQVLSVDGSQPLSSFPTNTMDATSLESEAKRAPYSSRTKAFCALANAALRVLIGGRQARGKIDAKVLRTPKHTLTGIAPSLWSPGFTQAMRSRQNYTSSIAHTLAGNVRRNAQSPSLKQKLALLEARDKTEPSCHQRNSSLEPEPTPRSRPSNSADQNRLALTLQHCMWRMMQHSLYDPSAARYLNAGSNLDASEMIPNDADAADDLFADEDLSDDRNVEAEFNTRCDVGEDNDWNSLLDDDDIIST